VPRFTAVKPRKVPAREPVVRAETDGAGAQEVRAFVDFA
jgi:hypothetical protein